MARRKKKKGSRSAASTRSLPPSPPAASPAPPDGTIGRLYALRTLLAAGDTAGALADVDRWLDALGAGAPTAPDAAQAPPVAAAGPIAETPIQSTGVGPSGPTEAPSPLQPLDVDGPRFSVLMAAYNRADLIGEAIDSVLAQDFADWELVIVDDGSTDDTPAVVGRYAEAEPRIRYVRKALNEGRSPTRNRAMAEARGEFVLWMADDDLLVPGVLTRYDGILRAEPVDIVYGKLQLFEDGRDLNVYTPNDWTGREAELLGAELHGSCVPDGGTTTRRALYAHVGAPIYDPEFVRAQDYELWTRLLPHARVRYVDEVVYRYRKHDGGTSWGDFVDLSFDSKIIRRHLSRHPIEALFTPLDWSSPDGARRAAMIQLGRLMLIYQDPHNAERFFAAVPDGAFDPEVVEQRVIGRLMAGDLDGAAIHVDAFEAGWSEPHPLTATLRARIEDIAELRRRGRAAVGEGRPSEAERRAVDIQNRHGLGVDVALLRAMARDAGGDRLEGLYYACQAARLAIDHDGAATLAERMRADQGATGPKFDVKAMRARLRGAFGAYAADPMPAPGAASITAVLIADGHPSAAVDRALRSVRAQRRAPAQIVVVGGAVEDPTVLHVPAGVDGLASRKAGLDAATGDLVAWLTADACWHPHHLARLAARLEADDDAAMAWGDQHIVQRTLDGAVRESGFAPPPRLDADRLLADDLIPLCALMHRRRAAPDDAFEIDAHPDWLFALDLSRAGAVHRVGMPTVARPAPTPEPEIVAPDADRRRALETVFARHPTALLFSAKARARQAERLAPFGVDWPTRGRTGVVILGADDLEAFATTLASIARHTRSPHAVVVVSDGPSQATREALDALAADHTRVYSPRRLSPAKHINLGLARAGGDRVALLRAGVEVSDGWLGRLRGWAKAHPEVGVVMPLPNLDAIRWGESGAVSRPDDRCVLITRAALEAVGGADVTLDPMSMAWDDWMMRIRQASFGFMGVADVIARGDIVRWASPVDGRDFTRRWGDTPTADRLPPVPPGTPVRCPYGAEEGFRPDIPPVSVLDGAEGPRVLVMPPWRDPALLGELVTLLGTLPASVSVWLRVDPGDGAAALDAVKAAGPEPAAPIWIVDAALAPDREGGLFTAVDGVYVDPRWPDAGITIRRAYDCGWPPLRDAAALGRWARISGGRR